MILPQLVLLSMSFATPAPTAAEGAVPQSQGVNAIPHPGRRNPQPSGGTPEPASMLLVAGAALAYGAIRRRKAAMTAVKIEA